MEELLNAIQKASAECAYDRVIELCCQGLEINPYMIEFTMRLANAYEKSGEFLNAYKYYTITGFLNQYHGEYQKTYIEEALERVVTAIEVHTGQLQGGRRTVRVSETYPGGIRGRKKYLWIFRTGVCDTGADYWEVFSGR